MGQVIRVSLHAHRAAAAALPPWSQTQLALRRTKEHADMPSAEQALI